MTPIDFTGARQLGAPKNWDANEHGECEVLPVLTEGVHNYSFWKPSQEELILLIEGKSVRLTVVGNSHPPVWVDVTEAPV